MSESKYTVSVIIPVYQAVDYLERAVKSVFLQENVIEIFLVEDGSVDGSYDLCRRLEAEYSKVKVLIHEGHVNKGQSASRNLALKFATGEWIQFLDADDELLPRKIILQLSQVVETTPFVVGNAIDKFLDGRENKRRHVKDIWVGLFLSKAGITSANLWNKKIVDLVGGFNPDLLTSVEYDLMFRMLQISERPVFDDNFLVYIHMSPNSICRDVSKQKIRVKNWVNLRLRIKEYLISERRYNKLSYRYYFSAGIGSYLENNQECKSPDVNLVFFIVYKFNIYLKRLVYNFISRNVWRHEKEN
jgi:glycosyltransferase involved in cell wall biosynthesis